MFLNFWNEVPNGLKSSHLTVSSQNSIHINEKNFNATFLPSNDGGRPKENSGYGHGGQCRK